MKFILILKNVVNNFLIMIFLICVIAKIKVLVQGCFVIQ